MTTGELIVDLEGGGLAIAVANSECDADLFFRVEISSNKKQKPTKIARELRRNKSSLRKLTRALLQATHNLLDQKQSHMFKI